MKSSLHSLFKADEDTEKHGVWFNISETVGFRLKRFNDTNPQLKAAMAVHYKPYARQIDMGTLSPAKEREIMAKLFAQVCLVDWKGVEIDGEEVGCNSENAVKLFMELPDLFDTLFAAAKDFANFKVNEDEKIDVGNS